MEAKVKQDVEVVRESPTHANLQVRISKMVIKLMVAFGQNRDEVRSGVVEALDEYEATGAETKKDLHAVLFKKAIAVRGFGR